MKLMDYRNASVPLTQVKHLLVYAVGMASDEKIRRILEQVYSGPNTTLYVSIDDKDTALGIIGCRRGGDSTEILHIAVDERKRRQGIGREMINKFVALEKPTELVAETDNDAVGFYRRYGFSIRSLGEKYPGVERFHCSLLIRPRS